MPFDPDLERRVAALAADSADRASEALLRGYGGEIFTFLRAIVPDAADADDAFSMFAVDVWRGLPGFRHQASYRTWAYQIARHAAFRLHRGDDRRNKRFVLDDGDAAARVAAEVKSTTAAFLRTDVKDRMRALRDALSPEDRELVILHLDRGLEFADIAVILGGNAPALRKRYERIKDKLGKLAVKAGVLPAPPRAQR